MINKILVLLFFLLSCKISAQVNFQWIKKFNTGGTINEVTQITTDKSGNIYVCLYTNKYSTGLDIVIIKYNTNGDSIWTRRYNDSLNLDDMPKAMVVDGLNNIVIAGNTATPSSGLDGLLLKYASNGELLWKVTYNYSTFDDDFKALALDNLNNIYVTGSSKESSFLDLQCITLKYNAQGNQLWISKYGFIPYVPEYGFAICLDPTNQFCNVLAQSDGEGTAFGGLITIRYGCVLGDSLWTKTHAAGRAWTLPRTGKIISDNFGNIYAATSSGITTPSRDFLLMKYAPSGDSLWKRSYGEVSGQGDEIRDIKIDNNRNVYVTGESNMGNNSNWSTIKYDSNGVSKWVSVFNRANYFDVPCGLFIDKSGNILVGGYGTVTTLPYSDYMLNKYNSSNGALINSFINTNNYYDYCRAMATDTSGNIFLTGVYSTTSSVIDFGTMKLSPSVGINQIGTEKPLKFSLYQNYPNPFNPTTSIRYQVASIKHVKLVVFNILGKEVMTLVNEKQNPGTYEVMFEGNNLASGIYFYQLNTDNFIETKKLILLK